ncbi:MAG: hypothetical protein ACT4PV_01865 [Planctomycetaceae bacterium]
MGGDGQARILAGSILLRGYAPLCEGYLRAAGVGRVAGAGEADLVVDLADGAGIGQAGFWGGALGRRVLVGVPPVQGEPAHPAARALVEALAAGEALRMLLGVRPHAYDFVL